MHTDKKIRRATAPAIAVLLAVSCTDEPVANVGQDSAGDSTAAAETSAGIAPSSDASAGDDSATTSGATTSGPHIFDVAGFADAGHGRPPTPTCKVIDGLDAVGDCQHEAPPDSFAPTVQWAWAGNGGEVEVIVTPLVANLTDDNDDGAIDLCDIPDVVVVAFAGISGEGHIYVLDGATGAEHFRIDNPVGSFNTPAVGDLDGDGVPEIVAVHGQGAGDYRMFAVHHDGTLLWESPDLLGVGNSSISLADLDADGDVEIVVAGGIFDHQGARIWQGPFGFANTAADLDGDDDLEVVTGGGAYHHDGSLYFSDSGGVGPDGWIDRAIPHVADLDLDGEPEVMFVGARGITIVEHDGTVTTTNSAVALADRRPAAIHDLDGDFEPEIAVGALNSYSALEIDLAAIWTAPVDDTGHAGGTAFDFLGDGTAEGIYADHTTLFVFDDAGTPLFSAARSSGTALEYPVVADVDNDGSAEIVVVSNGLSVEGAISPPVQVLRDAEDRWIPARRIWNQEDYHVTNVREDGTIPQVEPKNWLTLNTFRTQAQIQAGEVCNPEPAG